MRYRITSTCLGVISGLFLLLASASMTAATEFYYFNPDSPQSNLAHLKQEMDTVLATASSPISFQPFARLRDFKHKIREEKPAFLFLPSWYLDYEDSKRQFEPLLMSTRQGSPTYQKVLLVQNNSSTDLDTLAQKTIAMTYMGPDYLDFLNEIIFTRHGLNSRHLNIVSTSKDSDAIFALALRQVDAALVSKDNLEHIGKINPRILKAVRAVAESDPIPLPVICYSKEKVSAEEVAEVKEIFLNGHKGPKNDNLMEMLKIDEWRTYSH